MMFDVISHADRSLPPISVKFVSSDVLDKDVGDIIGSISKEGSLHLPRLFPKLSDILKLQITFSNVITISGSPIGCSNTRCYVSSCPSVCLA